jgi:hypothetical protein
LALAEAALRHVGFIVERRAKRIELGRDQQDPALPFRIHVKRM